MGIPSAPAKQRLVTQQQYDEALKQFDASANGSRGSLLASARQSLADSMLVPPPPPPDMADELVQARAQQVRRKLLMGGMTGPLNLSPGATVAPGLKGI